MQKIREYLIWFKNYSCGVRGALVGNVLRGLAAVSVNLCFIAFSKKLIDLAVSVPASAEKNHTMVLFSACLVGFMLVRVAANIFRMKIESNSLSRLTFSTRASIFQSLMFSVWAGRSAMHTGDETNRIFTDVDTVSKMICEDFPSLCVTAFQLIAAFVFLSTMNLTLALVLLCITPVFVAFSKVFVKRLRSLTKGVRDAESGIQSHIQDSLQQKAVLQAMERDVTAVSVLEDMQSEEYGQILRRTRLNSFSRAVVSVAFGLGYASALLFGVFGIAEGAISFGVMTAFLQLVGQIQGPAVQITRRIPSIVYATSSLDRLLELSAGRKKETEEACMLSAPAGVRVTELTFRYPDGESDVLSDFSYDFIPGSRTAIVGETGVGKSTLIRLMLGLLNPVKGEVDIYSDVSQPIPVSASTRCNFVYVPQGNSLFSGTIRDNLQMGSAAATDEEMWKALELACADDFVRSMPYGLDTVCGEKGSGLSLGQSQRVAIARALLRPGSIVLFDEFSSSLDPSTEKQLLSNLSSELCDKTMIFITHREVVADYCDKVVRLS